MASLCSRVAPRARLRDTSGLFRTPCKLCGGVHERGKCPRSGEAVRARPTQSGSSPPPGPGATRSLVGELLSGKYRVRTLIGSGGTSDVYEAKHEPVGATVAIKVLHAQRAGDSKAHARFLLEARLATTLKHANVCEVLDLGRLPDGRPFLVMERLVGETFAARLQREAIVVPRDLVEIMAPLLHGLAAVHQIGAIHLDLKPANVFLVQRAGKPPTTKLLDFGVARSSTRDHTPVTSVGFIVGTPLYMSPEQIAGSARSTRSRTSGAPA